MLRKMMRMALVITCALQLSFAWMVTPSYATTSHHHKKTHTAHHHKKKLTKHHKPEARANIPTPEVQKAIASEEINASEPSQPSFVASIGEGLIHFVHQTIETLSYSKYKLGGTRVEPKHGVYVVDCSTYVDYILKNVHPQAYDTLTYSMGTDKPTTQHYYDFFSEMPDRGKNYWNRVDEVSALRPGDILVFRNKNPTHSLGNHVMVVMNKPVKDTDEYLVRVADSAPVGHTHDTRPSHVSGIGIGTLQIKVDKEDQPSAYAWRVGSRWKNNVNIAMARPLDIR